jgi:prolyl 4-hydroxylase
MENFIGGWYLNDLSICDKIIIYYQNCPRKEPGLAYDDAAGTFIENKKIKDSIDVELQVNTPEYNLYINELTSICSNYTNQFPYASTSTKWGLLEKINIQHYLPGGGFHNWHCERSSGVYPGASRHLVFMTYLNDVTDNGETEFWHQKIKVKPEKGLTLIWPADWTYTHKGIASPTQDKYIVTGWISFLDEVKAHPVKL